MIPRTPLGCAVCDADCYEELSYEKGRQLRRLARAREGVRQVEIAMLSGSKARLTLCKSCEITPENLLKVWRRCALGPMLAARNDDERSKLLRLQHRDVPVGVLKVRPHEHFGSPIPLGEAE